MILKGPIENPDTKAKNWILETGSPARCHYCLKDLEEGYYCQVYKRITCKDCEYRKVTNTSANPCKSSAAGHIHYKVLIKLAEQPQK